MRRFWEEIKNKKSKSQQAKPGPPRNILSSAKFYTLFRSFNLCQKTTMHAPSDQNIINSLHYCHEVLQRGKICVFTDQLYGERAGANGVGHTHQHIIV